LIVDPRGVNPEIDVGQSKSRIVGIIIIEPAIIIEIQVTPTIVFFPTLHINGHVTGGIIRDVPQVHIRIIPYATSDGPICIRRVLSRAQGNPASAIESAPELPSWFGITEEKSVTIRTTVVVVPHLDEIHINVDVPDLAKGHIAYATGQQKRQKGLAAAPPSKEGAATTDGHGHESGR
jgi:hypothetical protein